MITVSGFISNPANRWQLVVLGRQSGLRLFREMIRDEQSVASRKLLEKAYRLEKLIIVAARAENQVDFDRLCAESREVFAALRVTA